MALSERALIDRPVTAIDDLAEPKDQSARPTAATASPASWWPRLAIALLSVVATLCAIGPIYRAHFLAELNINEGWNAYFADAVLKGRPLYPSPSQLITNNYPPLSFLVVAAIASVTGVPLFVGRVLSLVSLFLTSITVFAVLRSLRADRLPAVIGAAVYEATMCRLFDGHVGINDPQLLGNALTALGFLLFLWERRAGARWHAASALLMASAGFVKPFLFAMPASAFAIRLSEDRRAAFSFAGAGLVFALGGLGLCRIGFGPDFVSNLFYPRPYSIFRGLKSLEDLHKIGVQLAAWLVCLAATRDGRRRQIINVLCVFGAAESFLVRGAEEVSYNAGYDFIFAVHLALGVALDQLAHRPRAPRIGPAFDQVAILAITLRLLFGGRHDAFNAIYSEPWRRELRIAEASTKAEVLKASRIRGAVFCESSLVCYLAHKPFVVDPINVRLRIEAGALRPDTLPRLYQSGRLSLLAANPLAVAVRH